MESELITKYLINKLSIKISFHTSEVDKVILKLLKLKKTEKNQLERQQLIEKAEYIIKQIL